MVQMHSYLTVNAKSELKFLNDELTTEALDETFNEIALAINNGDDLFDDNKPDIDFTIEDHEIVNLEGVNDNNLEITNFIDLSSSLLNIDYTNLNRNNQEDEENTFVNHGDLEFDVDELIDNFQSSNLNN